MQNSKDEQKTEKHGNDYSPANINLKMATRRERQLKAHFIHLFICSFPNGLDISADLPEMIVKLINFGAEFETECDVSVRY